jgi:hypothetical protein
MKTHTVKVGCDPNRESSRKNTIREVEFEGERLAKVSRGDHRGVNLTLYDTPGRGLILHVYDYSHWQGESSTYEIRSTTREQIRDREPKLARKAGFDEPVSLDKVMS